MKFSIIVPVYNVEQYLKKCIESLVNQTYQPYEILLVNDGTKDNSQEIIDEYKKKYPLLIKSFIKENGGLSDARNYGVSKATGDYIVFVDSDDYIELDLLEVLSKSITNNEDVIGYGLTIVDNNYKICNKINKPIFTSKIGEDALKELIEGKEFFETAWTYCYNLEFWNKNKFQYEKGRFHEDFGLTPYLLVKASNVKTIEYNGYYYYQNNNGIMRSENKQKSIKKIYDMLWYFDFHKKETLELIKKEEVKNIFKSYLANSVINRKKELKGEEKKKYIEELKKRNVVDMLVKNTFFRKLKKYKIELELFMNI